MQRPHVGLDNFSTVYDFYRRHEQSRAFAWFAHRALARTYKVSITADDGAEAAIDEAITAGKRVIISPNHITADDQYVIVSTAETMKSLRPLRGKAFIPAEPSLFTRSGWQGRMLRRSVDGLGALPTFRLEDLRRQGIEVTEEVKDRYQRAVVKASETQVAKLIAGHSMAGFWEGTRNRSDYRVVQPQRRCRWWSCPSASTTAKNPRIMPVRSCPIATAPWCTWPTPSRWPPPIPKNWSDWYTPRSNAVWTWSWSEPQVLAKPPDHGSSSEDVAVRPATELHRKAPPFGGSRLRGGGREPSSRWRQPPCRPPRRGRSHRAGAGWP